MKSNLFVVPASSLSICGCIPSGIINVYVSRLFKCSKLDLYLLRVSFVPHFLWHVWSPMLPIKTQKEEDKYFLISVSFVIRSPHLCCSSSHVFLSLPVADNESVETLLDVVHIACQIQSRRTLAFVTVYLHTQMMWLYSSSFTCSCFHSL